MSAAKSLTSTELEQVIDYIATKPNAARNRAMLLTTVLAGLRVSEVAGLMLADIVDERDHIRTEVFLAAQRVKHAHARTIYISTRLQQELDLYIRSRTWV